VAVFYTMNTAYPSHTYPEQLNNTDKQKTNQ